MRSHTQMQYFQSVIYYYWKLVVAFFFRCVNNATCEYFSQEKQTLRINFSKDDIIFKQEIKLVRKMSHHETQFFLLFINVS